MRAIGFASYGAPEVLTLLDLPLPEAGPGEVRIRVAAAAVNPADWRLRSGQFKRFLRIRLPFVPGSDLAGVVDAVGEGVSDLQVGQAVLAMTATKTGGAYAEHVVLPAADAAPAPPGRPLGELAALPLCGLTALQALRRADLGDGDQVLVHGAAGGVGSLAVQIARALGARVTAVTSSANVEQVSHLGASRVLDRSTGALDDEPAAYDVVLDAVDELGFRRARRLLRRGGTAVTVRPFADKLAPDWLAWTRGGRRLRSVLVQPSGEDLRQLGAWVAAGQLRPVVEQTYPLADAAEAHRRSETGRVRGKLLLVVDEELAATVVAPQQVAGAPG